MVTSKAAAVPSTIDAVVTLLILYGTKSFEEVVQPTLAILDAGGPSWYIDTGSEKRIETGVNWQADLAVTLRKLVESEKEAKGTRQQRLQAVSDRFYRGDVADALEAWYIEKGGFLRKPDLAAHKTPVVDPLEATYRGYTVYKAGPLTQGPYLVQTLRLLEGFDLKKMGFNSADYIHTVIEAEKLALADRDEYYGDPSYVKGADATVAFRAIHQNAARADRSEKGIAQASAGRSVPYETDQAAHHHRPLAWRNHRDVCDGQVWERDRGDS
jgi:gamma-glutamyltranspeptidase/glutathione hydrolase